MKLFNAIAAAAVIGASMIVAPPAAEAGRNCPAGTSYHNIKVGGLLFKRTVAEGCFTDYEAASLKVNANSAHRAHVQRVLRNANQNQQRQCFGSATSIGNYSFGNASCY